MNFDQAQVLLNDLPATFKRLGAPYTQWLDALTTALATHTESSDALLGQLDFATAQGGWVDVWGSLAGIPRRPGESTIRYKARIQTMVLATRATPVAILAWLKEIELADAELAESLPTPGYTVQLPATLTAAQVQQILDALAYVRPAGVPFNITSTGGGTYVSTVNYLGAPRTTGAYLAGNSISTTVVLEASTNNFTGILPDLLFQDPLLNPSLAPAS